MPWGEIILNFVTKWANRWISLNLWLKHRRVHVWTAWMLSWMQPLAARLWEPPVRHLLTFHVRHENNSPKIKGSLSRGKCPLGDLIKCQVVAALLWNWTFWKEDSLFFKRGKLEVKAVLVFAVGMQKHNVSIKRRRGSWYLAVSQSPILAAVHVNAVLLQRGASHLYVCSAWAPSYTEEDMKFGLCQNWKL